MNQAISGHERNLQRIAAVVIFVLIFVTAFTDVLDQFDFLKPIAALILIVASIYSIWYVIQRIQAD